MNLSHSFRTTVAIAACTAVAAQSALAAGEQKNTRPFTAQASHSRTTGAGWTIPATAVAADLATEAAEANGFDSMRAFAANALERYLDHGSGVKSSAGTGEAKNQGPFTRPVGRSA